MLFKPGDVIEREKPFTAILDLKEKRKRCDYCFEEFKPLKRCSKCKLMFYCGEQCQRYDWKCGHKYTECNVYQLCGAFKKANPKQKTFIDYDTPRLLLRFYLYTYYNPKVLTKEERTYHGRVRSVDKLMEHGPDVKAHKDRMLIFDDIKLMFEESSINYDEALLFRLFCKMYINGFSIMNSMLLEIGRAVYLRASQFDHSCVPNAITTFFGSTVEVRAIQEIDTEKQEILVSYLNVMESVKKRQEILARGYYFKCQCERCVFELKHVANGAADKPAGEEPIICRCPPEPTFSSTEKIREAGAVNRKVGGDKVERAKESGKNAAKSNKSEQEVKESKQTVKSKDKKDVKGNAKQAKGKPNDPKEPESKSTEVKPIESKPIESEPANKKANKTKENVKLSATSPDQTSKPVENKAEATDWQQVKKTRNQRGKKTNSKPSTPEPPAEKEAAKEEPVQSEPKKKEPIKPEQAKVEESAKTEPQKESPSVKPPESVKIVETKADDAKKESPERAAAEAAAAEQPGSKLQLPNQQAAKSQNRLQARSPRRRSSKSPMPRNKVRSPLPGTKEKSKDKAKEKGRPKSKSPLPKEQGKSANKENETSADSKQNEKNETTNVEKPSKKKHDTKTPTPVRFVPYTEIERECLERFDELNKQFTVAVEARSWPEADRLAKQLYKCYLTYYRGDFAAEITLHIVQSLQIKRNLLREQFSLENDEVAELFNELKKNILVTNGAHHSLYRKDFLDLLQTIEATTKLAK